MLEHLLLGHLSLVDTLIYKCYFISISFNILVLLFKNKLLVYHYKAKYLIPGLGVIYSAICILIAGIFFNLNVGHIGDYFLIAVSRGLIAVGLYQFVHSAKKLKKFFETKGGANKDAI